MQSCGALAPDVSTLPAQRIRQKIVRPTAEQEMALDDLTSASSKAKEIISASCPKEIPLTPLSRLDAAEKRLEAMIQAVEIVRSPLEKFYDSLSDEQKRRLEARGSSGEAKLAIYTVVDATDDTLSGETATGFVFEGATGNDMVHCIGRAVALYQQPMAWRKLQRQAMARDFSWAGPARQYLALYQSLVPRRDCSPVPQAVPTSAAAATDPTLKQAADERNDPNRHVEIAKRDDTFSNASISSRDGRRSMDGCPHVGRPVMVYAFCRATTQCQMQSAWQYKAAL